MEINWKGKVAVITGAGGGIGRATATALAKMGLNIVLLGGNCTEKLEETRKAVSEYAKCLVIPGDLTNLQFVEKAVKEIEEKCGGTDVLINNAGMALNCSFEDVSVEKFDKIMAINVRVPFFLTQFALHQLKKSDCATVINISSANGHAGYPMQSAYVASKHAVLGFTKSLAREYYKDNIRVHAICPGGVYTDMIKIARPDLTEEGMITAENIADIIKFFLEQRSNGVIDEVIIHRVNKEPFLI